MLNHDSHVCLALVATTVRVRAPCSSKLFAPDNYLIPIISSFIGETRSFLNSEGSALCIKIICFNPTLYWNLLSSFATIAYTSKLEKKWVLDRFLMSFWANYSAVENNFPLILPEFSFFLHDTKFFGGTETDKLLQAKKFNNFELSKKINKKIQ